MRTFPSFGEPQDQRPSQSSGRLKLLYMSHLALGDYIYQGPFLKALTQCYSNTVSYTHLTLPTSDLV